MFDPVKIVSLDISKPLKDIENLNGYKKVRILCKWQERPVCCVNVSVVNNICPAELIIKEIEDKANTELVRMLLIISLEKGIIINEKSLDKLILNDNVNEIKPEPLVTVAVCTRDRAEQLKLCLDSLIELNYQNLDLIVIDNAPSNNSTKDLVLNKYSQFRYIKEERPGLDWARNRAILEAKGEIIAYTDDDVIVDENWVTAIVKTFLKEPDTMAVTGLVEPYELEADSHILFEMYGGFSRGYKPRWINIKDNPSERWKCFGTGQYGTGANMAFRRSLFNRIGYFDNALDVGTVTNGGGDLDMFFRVLKFGFTLKYDPNAIVFHRHRDNYQKLKKQLTDNGIGLYSYLVKNILVFREDRVPLIKLGIYWLLRWNLKRLIASYSKPLRFPRDLIRAELMGSLIGLLTYKKSLKKLKDVEKIYGKVNYAANFLSPPEEKIIHNEKKYFAVKMLNLNEELKPISDIGQYQFVRIFVSRGEKLLGSFDHQNNFRNINLNQLKELIIEKLGIKINGVNGDEADSAYSSALIADYKKVFVPENSQSYLPNDVPVSIVIGTYDRVEDLTACLLSLTKKSFNRKVEIIVVDNNPSSGLTPSVVKNFPNVKLINELRKGVSFARNAGIRAASGEIIITIDDDVIVSESWLEKIIAPFRRNDVVAVTGNILPFQLESSSQFMFEIYGGLGEGFDPKEFDTELFEKYRFLSFPAWEIGATSNSAFRAEIFSNTNVGLLDETLGPGTPTGVGEDTYLYYKILKNGNKIVYEPNAFVWHKHRNTLKALGRQIYNYSKGHVAYHLTILFKDKDFRALTRLFFELPLAHVSRIYKRLRGKSKYTLLLILLEVMGNLYGPFAYMLSNYRVKKIKKENSKPFFANQKITPVKDAG